MAGAATRAVTADELLAMPDDGTRRELVRGELRTMTPAGANHGVLAARLLVRLGAHVERQGLGATFAAETGFRIDRDPDTVLAPDVAFVLADRLGTVVPDHGFGDGPPDLVAEVVSPRDTYGGLDEKVDAWLTAGVRMVLVVHPRRRAIDVHRPATGAAHLTEDDVLDGGDVVPGWVLPVRELFA
jgi:Uma2 family endonuclease